MSSKVFYVPAVNLLGKGCINELGGYIQQFGYKKGLIITDKFLSSSKIIEKVKAILEKS